jgi:fructose-1,6-bisphosphatase/inositol monophosphatase family enzyme
MNLHPLPLSELCDIAIAAAREAGLYIQGADRNSLQRNIKEVGSSAASQLVTEVDIRSEAIIRGHLQSTFESWDIAFVGEESSVSVSNSTPERLSKPYFWCVDPLDGTLPFVEGSSGYAVSIALVEKTGIPLIGVVYDPVDSTLLHAIRGQGVYRNQSSFSMENLQTTTLMAFMDASFKTQHNYTDVLNVLNICAQDSGLDGVTLVYGSGAVKNACQVLEHATACYVKLPKPEDGGGSIWDYAATACITGEAGGWVSNIHGQPLELNRQGSAFMNHQGVLYASNKGIARYLVDALLPFTGAGS